MTKAKANFQRADQLYRSSVRLFYVFALIMLVVIAYQVAHLQNDFTNQQSQAINQRDKDTAAARKRLEDALIETKNQQVVLLSRLGSSQLPGQAQQLQRQLRLCQRNHQVNQRKIRQLLLPHPLITAVKHRPLLPS
jgi:E3 ubiquitin-protein ligase DOA10